MSADESSLWQMDLRGHATRGVQCTRQLTTQCTHARRETTQSARDTSSGICQDSKRQRLLSVPVTAHNQHSQCSYPRACERNAPQQPILGVGAAQDVWWDVCSQKQQQCMPKSCKVINDARRRGTQAVQTSVHTKDCHADNHLAQQPCHITPLAPMCPPTTPPMPCVSYRLGAPALEAQRWLKDQSRSR